MKKIIYVILMTITLGILYGCVEDDPIDPIDPIVPVEEPIDLALAMFDEATSYTMTILFESGEESYTAVVNITENSAKVSALNEIVYYEVDGQTCYIYEYAATSWTKTVVTCSDKDAQELMFLTDFSKDILVKENDSLYSLDIEEYGSLGSFLNGAITSDFELILVGNSIGSISFAMTRNEITMNVTISLSNFNSTTVTLPPV